MHTLIYYQYFLFTKSISQEKRYIFLDILVKHLNRENGESRMTKYPRPTFVNY